MTKPYWTTRLPVGWSVERLRHVTEIANSNVDKKSYDEGIPVRLCNYTDVYYNEYITSDLEFMSATATASELQRLRLRPGDVIITKDSESWDDIAVPACVNEELENVVCGYHLTLMRAKCGRMTGRFLLRALQAEGVREQFWLAANGVTRFGLGQQGMKDALVPVPPVDIQNGIADFLDEKTEAIDDLISKKERLIELLEEKRAALINRAVTKGLDPDVPMKDSGLPWIGKIPEYWKTVRLKQLLTRPLENGIFKKKEHFGRGTLLVNVGDVYENDLAINPSTLQRVDADSAERQRYQVRAGDIFFVRSSLKKEGVAVSAIVNEVPEPMVFECHLVSARPDSALVDPRFLILLLNSRSIHEALVAASNTTTMTTIDQQKLAGMWLPLPPLSEQQTIRTSLERTMSFTEEAMRTTTCQIEKLREYRQSLITAAVTGQIDVTAAEGVAA